MRHIDEATALAAAEGTADPRVVEHLGGCNRCRDLVASFARLVRVLSSRPENGEIPGGLQRWAQAYARTRDRQPSPFSVLGLLSRGAPFATATRGGALHGVALLFGDERHQVDVRIQSSDGESVCVHGHIVPLQESTDDPWEITVLPGSGASLRTTTDPHGEFWLEEVQGWQSLSLVATNGRERLVVARLGDGVEDQIP
jgi:hypothetical protein